MVQQRCQRARHKLVAFIHDYAGKNKSIGIKEFFADISGSRNPISAQPMNNGRMRQLNRQFIQA
jgi:hypothetical protein